jgi:hypothetical protein
MEPDWWFSNPDTVPPVDPSDLKKVWNLLAEEELTHSRRATDIEIFERVCSPGADTTAVWYRAGQTWLIRKYSEHSSTRRDVLSRHMPDGVPDDLLLKIAATIPMEKMPPGVIRNSVPFDVDKFFNRLNESEEHS